MYFWEMYMYINVLNTNNAVQFFRKLTSHNYTHYRVWLSFLEHYKDFSKVALKYYVFMNIQGILHV